ncbi:hypothetical protein NPIL_430921 [Nephila pilipes]|uniref:Uncharacterized protein n=1 Tax=Nephila pilipes TaxID=299642 RepID=A0A8X6QVS4_NEPPI|nr:hypothetical protein NPIL_430921 [Nephila pilipes]
MLIDSSPMIEWLWLGFFIRPKNFSFYHSPSTTWTDYENEYRNGLLFFACLITTKFSKRNDARRLTLSHHKQKAQEQIEFLSLLMENTAANLNAYKSRRLFDENDFSNKVELSRYREAEARQHTW